MNIEIEIINVLLKNGNYMTAKEIVRAINEKHSSSGHILTKKDVNPWLYCMDIFEKTNTYVPIWSLKSFPVSSSQSASLNSVSNQAESQSDDHVRSENGEAAEKHCDNCQLRKSGKCTQLQNCTCGDYLHIPFISESERSSWPQYGDATAARLNENRP